MIFENLIKVGISKLFRLTIDIIRLGVSHARFYKCEGSFAFERIREDCCPIWTLAVRKKAAVKFRGSTLNNI